LNIRLRGAYAVTRGGSRASRGDREFEQRSSKSDWPTPRRQRSGNEAKVAKGKGRGFRTRRKQSKQRRRRESLICQRSNESGLDILGTEYPAQIHSMTSSREFRPV